MSGHRALLLCIIYFILFYVVLFLFFARSAFAYHYLFKPISIFATINVVWNSHQLSSEMDRHYMVMTENYNHNYTVPGYVRPPPPSTAATATAGPSATPSASGFDPAASPPRMKSSDGLNTPSTATANPMASLPHSLPQYLLAAATASAAATAAASSSLISAAYYGSTPQVHYTSGTASNATTTPGYVAEYPGGYAAVRPVDPDVVVDQNQLQNQSLQNQNQSQNLHHGVYGTGTGTNVNAYDIQPFAAPTSSYARNVYPDVKPEPATPSYRPTGSPAASPRNAAAHDLIKSIPPLHVQQQIVNNTPSDTASGLSNQLYQSNCSRCKKQFVQVVVMPNLSERTPKFGEPKIFKLCDHCRDLQRERSRRWQRKTKDRQGACRRCGTNIPADQQNFVLCPTCRRSLRDKKAVRAAQGRCIHCSGPLEAPIISAGVKEDTDDGHRRSVSSRMNYKVCVRCRENDRIRRTNLEMLGNCNRCAKAMAVDEIGKHKVCHACRVRKRKMLGGNSTDESRSTDPSPRVSILSGHEVSGEGLKSPSQHHLAQLEHQLLQQLHQLLQQLQPAYWPDNCQGIFSNQYQMPGYDQPPPAMPASQGQSQRYDSTSSAPYSSTYYGGSRASYTGYDSQQQQYPTQYTLQESSGVQNQYQPWGEAGTMDNSMGAGKSQYFINPFSQQLRNKTEPQPQLYQQTQTYLSSPMDYQQQQQQQEQQQNQHHHQQQQQQQQHQVGTGDTTGYYGAGSSGPEPEQGNK